MVVFIFLSTYFFDFLEKIFRALKTLYLSGMQGNLHEQNAQEK